MDAKAKKLHYKMLKAQLEVAKARQMEAEYEAARSAMLYENTEEEVAHAQEGRTRERKEADQESNHRKSTRRPSRALWPDVYYSENDKSWVCRHSGVRALGDTPDIACDNFDNLWMYGK